ncbi:hypothetical protein P152DRAFT_459489 [Eremomyces bilateralis CBS 781.70]|uniref:Uncharacterized protein n=1 Tax=Eremomyces bilateralis CBS 781.70 TaxID=1392243 RepID=A0A6G1G0G6_9PEZI|nr:uncharacterized protein P152DRAFT_459489 [Eremomyces bilateralis CBS 781.70]KAF1811544.1 hypothetical protein P152DRAFT_459489 [Eremomyces bilateralis CBS 781.70]
MTKVIDFARSRFVEDHEFDFPKLEEVVGSVLFHQDKKHLEAFLETRKIKQFWWMRVDESKELMQVIARREHDVIVRTFFHYALAIS